MTQITITLNKIKAKEPCSEGWEAILKGRGKAADDEEFPLSEAFNSNSLEDVIWALRCLPEHDRLWRKFAVWCARQVQDQLTDERSIAALEVAWRHSEGDATDEELQAARAAVDAARDASVAARDALAAWVAARSATGALAWTAACDASVAARDALAARAAARSATGALAWNAAWAAACAVARASASDAMAAQKAKLIQILDAGEWVE